MPSDETKPQLSHTSSLVAGPPPRPERTLNYPGLTGLAIGVVATVILVFVAAKLDPTKGVLTVSFVILMGFMSTLIYAVLFTIPHDDTTAAVIGSLVAAFGAIISYWIRVRNGEH